MDRVAFLGVFLAACTTANPDYLPQGSDLAGRDAGAGDARGGDLAGARDLMVVTCLPGMRQCQGQQVLACVNGALTVDRTCPSDGHCEAGVCRPPQPTGGGTVGRQCQSENHCAVSDQTFLYSCQPFLVDERNPRIDLRCAHLFGMGGSGVPCSMGSECRSGFCIPDRKLCFRACTSDFDCPVRNLVKTVCREVMLTVESVPAKLRSCVLP